MLALLLASLALATDWLPGDTVEFYDSGSVYHRALVVDYADDGIDVTLTLGDGSSDTQANLEALGMVKVLGKGFEVQTAPAWGVAQYTDPFASLTVAIGSVRLAATSVNAASATFWVELPDTTSGICDGASFTWQPYFQYIQGAGMTTEARYSYVLPIGMGCQWKITRGGLAGATETVVGDFGTLTY